MVAITGCNGQKQQPDNKAINNNSARVGGDCEEGYCELMYKGMPTKINSTDTSSGWFEHGQKLIVTGTVFQIDGKTPAANVIIYYHHTDKNGYYSPSNDKPENQTRHGHIRGWVKTGEDGKYTLYTSRPAPYPDRSQPAHIHWLIKEPDVKNEYWTDDLMFDDDKLLLPFIKLHKPGNLGGNGIVSVLKKDSVQIAEHNFILGLNVLNYPKKNKQDLQTGLNIGEGQPSFDPYHAYGPDKGSTACPVCKYGRYHGILYFVGNKPNWDEIKKWLQFLEQESIKRQKFLKVYFVYGNPNTYNKENRIKQLEELGSELNLKSVALTFVPSFSDTFSNINKSRINSNLENTFIIFKQRDIIDKYVNLKPTEANFSLISTVLDKTRGEYFSLAGVEYE